LPGGGILMMSSFEHADKMNKRKSMILVGLVIVLIFLFLKVLVCFLTGFRSNTPGHEKSVG
jgi:hypothetical protein